MTINMLPELLFSYFSKDFSEEFFPLFYSRNKIKQFRWAFIGFSFSIFVLVWDIEKLESVIWPPIRAGHPWHNSRYRVTASLMRRQKTDVWRGVPHLSSLFVSRLPSPASTHPTSPLGRYELDRHEGWDNPPGGGVEVDRQKGWKGASVPALKHIFYKYLWRGSKLFWRSWKKLRLTQKGDDAWNKVEKTLSWRVKRW